MSLLKHHLARWIRMAAACAGGSAFLAVSFAGSAASCEIVQAASQPSVAKHVGVVKSVNGNTLTLTADSGTEIKIQVASNAKMVRVAPGQTDLKSAASIQLSDVHAGDRILVRGQPSSDGKTFVAVGIIAMSRSDVEARHASDREDWQKRGIGGLVNSVEPATGTVTISVVGAGGKKTIAIHTTNATILRRYAPDSVSFDEAKPEPIDQIKPGDQLRTRGTRSADGSEFAAEEIVSGSFRNIAGTISSIDANANSMIVMDLISKKPFAVKITSQSQLRSLPPEIAQRIALRLKGAGATGDHAGSGASGGSGQAAAPSGGSPRPEGEPGGNRPGGQADFQQIVNRMPAATLADFKKDEAVMIVATEGSTTGQATAITVIGGVEPILAATPTGGQAMTLSPWSLGGAPAGAGDTP